MSEARPGCGNTARSEAEPAWAAITMSCSKLSEPEYSTEAPVASSKYAITLSKSVLSSPVQGPVIDRLWPARSWPSANCW